MAKPVNSNYATIALLIAGGLLLSSVLLPGQNGHKTNQQVSNQTQNQGQNQGQNGQSQQPPFTQTDVRDALSFQEQVLLDTANYAAMFYTQTDSFPVRVADLTEKGENLWDGPYLTLDNSDHPLDLIWGQSPDAPMFEVCGVDPIFMADCFLWISAGNVPPAWFRVYDTYLDASDGAAAGQARYDEKAKTLLVEIRGLTIAPENGGGFSVTETPQQNAEGSEETTTQE